MYQHKEKDPTTGLIYNAYTQKWVKRINDRKGKVATSRYHVIHFKGFILDNHLPAYFNDSNILTRVSWLFRILFNSRREGTHNFKYLSNDQLYRILGYKYKVLLEDLRGAKLIHIQELINSHNTDQYTYSFRLSDNLLDRKSVRAIVTNIKVIKAMENYNKIYRFINVTDSKMREILLDNHNRAFINVFEPDSFVEYFNIEKEDHDFKICLYGDRTHSIFTRMKKELRLKVRDINEIEAKANEADIQNSQPYFLMLVFSAFNYLKKVIPGEVLQELYFLDEVISTKSYIDYRNEVLSGTFYDTFADALDEQLSNWYNQDLFESKRKQAKNFFYRIVFAADYMVDDITKEKNILYSLYPEVFAAVERIKSINYKEYFGGVCRPDRPYQPYKNITILLQRLESFITNMIYVNLYDRGIWALKCHDSFTFKDYQTPQVKEVIADTFEILKLNAPSFEYANEKKDK